MGPVAKMLCFCWVLARTVTNGSGDPDNLAQNLLEIFGKVIRLCLNKNDNLKIPSDNPFVGMDGEVLPEIFAYGFRNPFRMGFDSWSGELFVGDVGQKSFEGKHNMLARLLNYVNLGVIEGSAASSILREPAFLNASFYHGKNGQ